MATQSRTERIGDQIQRELAGIVQLEMHDPRVGMITINEVKVSRDLAWADVYFTTLGESEGDTGECEAVLSGASGFLRSALASRMALRSVPKLRFHYDASEARARRLEGLIDNAMQEDAARRARDTADGDKS